MYGIEFIKGEQNFMLREIEVEFVAKTEKKRNRNLKYECKLGPNICLSEFQNGSWHELAIGKDAEDLLKEILRDISYGKQWTLLDFLLAAQYWVAGYTVGATGDV